MNVLIVDDHLIIRKLISEILKKHKGLKKIFEAENGEEAKKILNNNEIELVLLDLLMPKTNGFEVLDYMKENKYSDIPTIVFSTDDDQKFKALDKGAQDFLHKPVSELKLISVIKKYIKID
jgi:CheY-like chemotaxis protein